MFQQKQYLFKNNAYKTIVLIQSVSHTNTFLAAQWIYELLRAMMDWNDQWLNAEI